MTDERDPIQRAADLRNLVDRIDEMIEKVEGLSDDEWRALVRNAKRERN